ncbi:hypothetical protein D3C81_901200 [compost metagenome]
MAQGHDRSLIKGIRRFHRFHHTTRSFVFTGPIGQIADAVIVDIALRSVRMTFHQLMVICLFVFLLCQIGAGGDLAQLRLDRIAVDKLHIWAPAYLHGIGQHRSVVAYDIDGIHRLNLPFNPFLILLALFFLLFLYFLRIPGNQQS